MSVCSLYVLDRIWLWELSVNRTVTRWAPSILTCDGVTPWPCHLWPLLSLSYYETTSEGLWSQEHREGLSLLLSPGYESPGLRLRDSSVDPSVHWVGPQDKSHYISSHPFALATNDTVLILPCLMLLWWCLLLLLSRVFSRVLRYRIWFSVELSGAHS